MHFCDGVCVLQVTLLCGGAFSRALIAAWWVSERKKIHGTPSPVVHLRGPSSQSEVCLQPVLKPHTHGVYLTLISHLAALPGRLDFIFEVKENNTAFLLCF